MKTESVQTAPTSPTQPNEVNGTASPVRKRNRRRRLPAW